MTWFRDGYCSTSSKSGYCWHPLDLLVQSGILTREGHTIAFIDAIALDLSEGQTLARINAFAPEAVLALAGDASWPEDVRFLRRMTAANDTCRLFVSGDIPRFETEKAFRELPALEGVVTDFATTGLAQMLAGEQSAAGITTAAGATPNTQKEWHAPPARHDLLTRQAYRLPFHSGAPFASVLHSYGCPFSCTFCNTGELGYKVRPVAETMEEMKVVKGLGYKNVYLRDATANGHRQSLLELCRAMAAEDLNLRWNTFCTFQPFDAELAQAMAKAGCRVVQIGFETSSDELRAASGKRFTNDAAFAAVRYAHDAGIKVCGHFVLGLPGQDLEGARATAKFARELDLDYASFNLAAARPGTELHQQAVAGGFGGGDASSGGFVEQLASVSARDLNRIRRNAVAGFYLRKRPLFAVAENLMSTSGWANLTRMVRSVSRII